MDNFNDKIVRAEEIKKKKKKSSKRIFPLSHENMQANKEANEE